MTTPRGVSKWFGITIVGGIAAALLFIGWAFTHKAQPNVRPPSIRADSEKDVWWAKYKAPTPTPTPAMQHFAESPYHSMDSPPAMPMQQPPAAKATPGMSEAQKERQRRLLAGMRSDIGVKADNGQMLETPHIVATGPAANAPLTVAPQPAPPHTIGAWTWIYGTLTTGVDSDHPGDVLGRVAQTVTDTVTQTEPLIPMGSIIHGMQDGRNALAMNDKSLIVRWDDIELPNGAHVHIGDMPGADPQGYPGFEDQVNNHNLEKWTPALMISALSAGSALASNPTYGSSGGYNAEQQAMGQGANRLGSFGQQQLMNQLLTIKPTITIRPGYTFRVLVTKDIVFDRAYAQAIR